MNKWLKKMLIGLCCLCMGTAVGLTAACTDDEESSGASETESSTSVESGDNDLGSSEESSVSEEEEPCEHVWDNGEIVAPATCMEDGVKQYLCTLCGDGKTEAITSIGHSYTEEVVAATCAEQGYTLHTCGNCDDSYKDTYTEVTAHNYVSSTVSATCTSQGYTLYSCSGCDDEHKDNYVPATGHAYAQVSTVAATCTAKGYTKYACGCGAEYNVETPALGHDTAGATWTKSEDLVFVSGCEYNEVSTTTCKRATCGATVEKLQSVYKHSYTAKITTPATCMASGVKTFTCGGCNDNYTESYSDANAHNFVAQASTFGTSSVVSYACECGQTKTAYSAKDNEGATVPNDAVQSGAEIELKNATMALSDELRNQLNGADVSLSATTQSAPSNMSQADKDRLGSNPVYNFTMEQSNSAVTDFGGAVMTITVPYTLGENEDPDEIAVWYINDQGVATAIPATYSNGTATFQTTHFSFYSVVRLTPEERCRLYTHMTRDREVAATCETDGYTVTYCIRCGHNEKHSEVEAFGHDYIATVTAATCTEKGYTTNVCSICNDTYVDNYVNENGHNYVATVKAPTCITKGYTLNVCSSCNDTYTDNYQPVSAHSYATTVVAPTCTEKGYTKYSCTVCKKAYSGEFTDAIGHNYALTGLCNNCGKMNPLFEIITEDNYYIHLFEKLLEIDSFYFVLEDFRYEMKMFENDVLAENGLVTIDLASLAFRPDENGYFVGGGEGSFVYYYADTDEENAVGNVYILLKDGHVYMYVCMDEGLTIPYEMTFDMTQDEFFNKAFGMNVSDMNEMMQSMPQMMEQAGLDKIVDMLETAKAEYTTEINLALKAIIEYLFAKTPTENGYDYAFNYDRILEIYDIVYGSSVIEVIDMIFGEGTYNDVYGYLVASLDKTVQDIETEIDVVLNLVGGDVDDVYTVIENVFMAQGEQAIDLSEEIKKYYSYTVSQMLDMMMGSEQAQDYAARLAELNTKLGEMTLADLLSNMGGNNNESNQGGMGGVASSSTTEIPEAPDMEGEVIVKPIKPMKQYAASEEMYSTRAMLEEMVAMFKDIDIGFTANKRGELLSVYLNIPEMAIGGGYNGPLEEGVEYTVTNTLGMNFTVQFNAELPELGAMAETKAQESRVDFDFEAILEGRLENGHDDYLGVMVDGKVYSSRSVKDHDSYIDSWVDSSDVTSKEIGAEIVDGVELRKYRLTTGLVVCVFDPEDISYMRFTTCKDIVQYQLYGKGWYPNAQFNVWVNEAGHIVKEELIVDTNAELQTGEYTEYLTHWLEVGNEASIFTYYNTLTGEFFYKYSNYIHDYVSIERVETSGCETKGYEVFQCTLCGESYKQIWYQSHQTRWSYVLVDGATSCLQGVREVEMCTLCGEVTWESDYVSYDHRTFAHNDLVGTTDCGDVYIHYYACACGQSNENRKGAYVTSNCNFYSEDNTVYVCQSCGYSYKKENYAVSEIGGCVTTYYVKYSFNLQADGSSDNVKTYVEWVEENHERITDYYPDENGNEVRFTECVRCGEVLAHVASKNDAYGRELFYVDYVNAYGYEYVYDAECNYVRYALIVNGMDVTRGEQTGEGTDHVEKWYYELAEGSVTCEDGVYEIYGCRVCGNEENYGLYYSHYTFRQSYVVPSACGGVSVVWDGCACGEEVRWLNVYDDSCIFDCVREEYLSNDVRRDWWQYEYRCPIKNNGEESAPCDLTYIRDQYYIMGENCLATWYNTYTFYSSSAMTEQVFTITEKDYTTMHDERATSVDLGNGVREVTWACVNCDYGYIGRYDRYGRYIYHSDDLNRTRGQYKVFDENCNYVHYEFYTEDGQYVEYQSYSGIEHANSWWYDHYLESSCTQYNLYYKHCEACDLYEYNEYGRPTEHYFEYNEELGHYVCWTCGLESDSDANGMFVMEDLTGRDGTNTLKAGFFNKYSVDEYDFDFSIVLNYNDNGVGTEVLYSNRGQDEVVTDLFEYMTYYETGLITFNMDVLAEAVADYEAQYGEGSAEAITISFSIYQRSTQTYIDHILTFDTLL